MDDVRKMLEQKHKVSNHLILRQNLNKYLNHREVVEPLFMFGRYVEEQKHILPLKPLLIKCHFKTRIFDKLSINFYIFVVLKIINNGKITKLFEKS